MGVDLGRDCLGGFLVGARTAPDLTITVLVVDPPRAVVEVAGDSADPRTARPALSSALHRHPPAHALCTKCAPRMPFGGAKETLSCFSETT
jgi:hypothetical protein